MPEAVAPAAPAAAPAPSGGTSSAGSATPSGAASKPPQGRGPHGQYLPRQGSDVPPAERPQAAEGEAPAQEPKGYKFKLKVDGREEEATYASQEELVRELQIARAAAKRMQEAAEQRKRLEAWESRLKEDPTGLLQEKGIDFDMLAAKRLAEKAKLAMMSQSEREAYQARREVESTTKELEVLRAEKRERLEREHMDKVWAEQQPKFLAAGEKHNLPKDPSILRLIAEVGSEFADAEIEIDPEGVMAEVARRENARVWDRVKAYPVEALEAKLGEETLRALAERYGKRLVEKRKANGYRAPANANLPPPKTDEPKRYIDNQEYLKLLKAR